MPTLRTFPTGSSVTQSCLTLCEPMDCSMRGFPVHHQFPRAYSYSCPSYLWCYLTISSCVVPFSHLQSFSASGDFPMSQFFTSGGQSIVVSASTSVFPMNWFPLGLISFRVDWFPLGLTGWNFLQSKGLSRVISNTKVQKHQLSGAQLSLVFKSHMNTWLLEKP